jgi:ATP-binding protein involved in chromosome partitioning
VVSDPASEHAKAYRQIADRMWEKLSGAASRQAPRIVVQ